jgi:hypothetical protein
MPPGWLTKLRPWREDEAEIGVKIWYEFTVEKVRP